MSELKVELKPHVGLKQTKVGMVKSCLNQSRIFVNGVLSGYVSDEPGSLVRLIVSDLPEEAIKDIKAQVDKLRGNVSSGVHTIPTIAESTFEVVLDEQVSDTTEIGI